MAVISSSLVADTIRLAMEPAAAESTAAEIGAAAESSSQGRIQDLVLPMPTDTTTGALAQIGMCNSIVMLS